MYNQFKSLFLFSVLFSLFAVSCQKEANETDVENYTNGAVADLQERSGCGMGGCFELVFPISIAFPDNTTATADSMQDLRTIIHEWKMSDPTVSGRPTFVFPISVIKDDGTLVTVNSEDELKMLRKECKRPMGPGHPGVAHHCFRIEFPFSVQKPDGTIVVIESASDFPKPGDCMGGRPHNGIRPELVFPINVTLTDGTSQVINSKEELMALKASCN